MTTLPPQPAGAPADSELMNHAIRMVTPLRREFGRSLDVPHFLHDFSYAREVVEQAASSSNERLREYAAYFQRHVIGPRLASAEAALATPGGKPLAPSAMEAATRAERQGGLSTEETLRERMLKKYSTGIR